MLFALRKDACDTTSVGNYAGKTTCCSHFRNGKQTSPAVKVEWSGVEWTKVKVAASWFNRQHAHVNEDQSRMSKKSKGQCPQCPSKSNHTQTTSLLDQFESPLHI